MYVSRLSITIGRRTLRPPTPALQVLHDATADELLVALTSLEPIYSAGVESVTGSTPPAWHVTIVSAQAYEPIFVDGYLLEGTNAAVTVSDNPTINRLGAESRGSCRYYGSVRGRNA